VSSTEERQHHWDSVYREKGAERVSWYRPRLDVSLELIEHAALPMEASIVDVGGGCSTLAGHLVEAGYKEITVIDLSARALALLRDRLGAAADEVRLMQADITRVELVGERFDLWHDRAVFHFLVEPRDRARYVERLQAALAPGGSLVIATFGPRGPERCSGLPVRRYGPEELHAELTGFDLEEHRSETHITPTGSEQQFTWCRLRRSSPGPGGRRAGEGSFR